MLPRLRSLWTRSNPFIPPVSCSPLRGGGRLEREMTAFPAWGITPCGEYLKTLIACGMFSHANNNTGGQTMLQYQVRRGKLVSLSYRVNDVVHDLNYLKSTPAWDMIGSLILAGDVDGANTLYRLAFSIAACDNWVRFKSGHWGVQYAGHILHVCSTGAVDVYLLHANENSQIPKDAALKATEVAYYIRRKWHEDRVARRTAERNTRREYRTYRSYNAYRYRIR